MDFIYGISIIVFKLYFWHVINRVRTLHGRIIFQLHAMRTDIVTFIEPETGSKIGVDTGCGIRASAYFAGSVHGLSFYPLKAHHLQMFQVVRHV